jgi:aminoglycoside/choline kinase family phosphotransferase
VIGPTQLRARLAELLGAPVLLQELKHKPDRRRTLRATGPLGSAIVKQYASERAPTVAARIASLADGPAELAIPRVLLLDSDAHLLVLEDLPGEPLRAALLDGDTATCIRVGASIGAWHRFWTESTVGALQQHTVDHEIAILTDRIETATNPVADAVRMRLPPLAETVWECSTSVHRDLYEEQILVADPIALIDLDDAALGPPELDIGNLLAHIRLLGMRSQRDLDQAVGALLDGYAQNGPILTSRLLERCVALSLLRLACIHHELALVDAADRTERR